MAEEVFRNIFIEGIGTIIPFTSPKQLVHKKFPDRDRSQHAQMLQNKLNAAWENAKKSQEQRSAVSLSTKQGVYIEFDSAPEFELPIKSLENRTMGIQLLNVKTIEVEGKPIKRATVYIPVGKENYFIKKIQAYEQELTPKGKPKNQELVECIEDIKLAVLESFWQDKPEWIPTDSPVWCEIWLSSDQDQVESEFRALAQTLEINLQKETLEFPERRVIIGKVNRLKLNELISTSPHIAEIRRASETAVFFTDLPNKDQSSWVRDLLERTELEENSNVYICILDGGVNNGNPLIAPLLKDNDSWAYETAWGTHDNNGHGTQMSGIAGYGDLQAALEGSQVVHIVHGLESCKILPPVGDNDPKLYGAITSQSVSNTIIENPERKRIICMAVTAPKYDTGDGRPSSWSAAIDELTSGYIDEIQKLFIVSAGNIADQDDWKNYFNSNLTKSVQNPGQAWNAITVGAYTEKTRLMDPRIKDLEVVAPNGGLSPFSSTSTVWEKKWPIKPEIVLEGGNLVKDSHGCWECEDLSILTTHYKPTSRQFDTINATSAATAKAAWMAAQIQATYSNAWPETIRGLLIHSADWTQTMKRQFLKGTSKGDYRELLRVCGYGVPNLENVLWCVKNSVNLIIQSKLQPFDRKENGGYKTRDMHIYELPWPKSVLLSLGEVKVNMKVTLSYFIEPGPGEIGWKDRYRYASCALRFDVNGTDTEEVFKTRINAAVRDEEEGNESDGGNVNWMIGKNTRHLGSIHSDIWTGTAAELATSNLVAVYPAIGWWRERPWLGRWNKEIKYSLIVSLHTPEQEVDLYTPIVTSIQPKVPIEIRT